MDIFCKSQLIMVKKSFHDQVKAYVMHSKKGCYHDEIIITAFVTGKGL
jgi:hypothetical protein